MDEKEYPFEFSVVMAVYNVAPFLREAVDSLIAQDFGFEKIQLIMVDDGSNDGSEAICDEYAGQYPENVLVIHKENGGVSSARNEGLKHIQGRYVNFLDSDDMLKSNALSRVHAFFSAHGEETDVVAIPMFFFDGMEGAHKLNKKFQRGSRVIDLIQEWQSIQLSCSTAFVRRNVADTMCFDTALAYGEDAAEMLRILMGKMTLGVVNHTAYLYRKRGVGTQSALQKAKENVQWYIPSVEGFLTHLISTSVNQLGYVPKYIQYAIMYDIQWRVLQTDIPENILSREEAERYKRELFSIMGHIDDDVVMAQKDIQIEQKAYLLKKKYGRDADIQWKHDDAILHYNNTYLCHLNINKTQIDFISLSDDSLCLEGYTVLLAKDYGEVSVWLETNGERIPCSLESREENRTSLGEAIYYAYGFKGAVPLEPNVERYGISVCCMLGKKWINKKRLLFGKFCPVNTGYKNSYYYCGGHALTTDGKKLYVCKCGRKGRIQREYAYLKELWKKNEQGGRKAVVARLLTAFLRPFQRKKIWLISDRINKADDNGEAFFRYVMECAPKDVKAYFALSPKSQDYKRIKKVGRVIPFLGWRHKLLYLLSDRVISSQGEEFIFHPFQKYSKLYCDLAQTQKFVFLQHGVTKDDLSGWLNRYSKNISMFVTTTVPEYQSILSYRYYYGPKVVKLTGFPRYDRLYCQEKKMITIMPTWRAYLVTGIDPGTGKRALKAGFHQSRYYDMYEKLLNSQRFFDAAERLGYTVSFLSHPNMSVTDGKMGGDRRLEVMAEDTAYRDVFAQSDLIVTDYSSVAFDFAYLRKPVVYYQADKDEFFSGAHTYEKGYFDYERDGFGEVEYTADSLVDRIIEYMETGCGLKTEYKARIDATFPFSDQENCRRVYEEIAKIEGKV